MMGYSKKDPGIQKAGFPGFNNFYLMNNLANDQTTTLIFTTTKKAEENHMVI